jgi:hypothetical protein
MGNIQGKQVPNTTPHRKPHCHEGEGVLQPEGTTTNNLLTLISNSHIIRPPLMGLLSRQGGFPTSVARYAPSVTTAGLSTLSTNHLANGEVSDNVRDHITQTLMDGFHLKGTLNPIRNCTPSILTLCHILEGLGCLILLSSWGRIRGAHTNILANT